MMKMNIFYFVMVFFCLFQLSFSQTKVDGSIALKFKITEFSQVEMKQWFPHRLIKATLEGRNNAESFYFITASLGLDAFQVREDFNCLCKGIKYTFKISEMRVNPPDSLQENAALGFIGHFVDFKEDGSISFKERPDTQPSWMNLSERFGIVYHNRVYFIEDISPKGGYSRHDDLYTDKECPCNFSKRRWK